MSGHAAAFVEVGVPITSRVIYVIGGADSTHVPRDTVYYATVGGSGTLSRWSATATLPAARQFSQAVVTTSANSSVVGPGYLFVLGGATDSTGTPSAWTTSTTSLPGPAAAA